jgi:hypothetical protein
MPLMGQAGAGRLLRQAMAEARQLESPPIVRRREGRRRSTRHAVKALAEHGDDGVCARQGARERAQVAAPAVEET